MHRTSGLSKGRILNTLSKGQKTPPVSRDIQAEAQRWSTTEQVMGTFSSRCCKDRGSCTSRDPLWLECRRVRWLHGQTGPNRREGPEVFKDVPKQGDILRKGWWWSDFSIGIIIFVRKQNDPKPMWFYFGTSYIFQKFLLNAIIIYHYLL